MRVGVRGSRVAEVRASFEFTPVEVLQPTLRKGAKDGAPDRYR
jgi:hypothetical protein